MVKILRVLRVLRPLRAINRAKGLKVRLWLLNKSQENDAETLNNDQISL